MLKCLKQENIFKQFTGSDELCLALNLKLIVWPSDDKVLRPNGMTTEGPEGTIVTVKWEVQGVYPWEFI